MPENERGHYIWQTFIEFFPTFREHVEDWKVVDANTISVKFCDDGYITSKKTYTFGDNGCDDWHLEMMK